MSAGRSAQRMASQEMPRAGTSERLWTASLSRATDLPRTPPKIFGDNQAESGDHGPAENRRAQRRVGVAVVIVRMRMVHVAIVVAVLGIVILIVGVVVHPVHLLHFTRLRRVAQDSRLPS